MSQNAQEPVATHAKQELNTLVDKNVDSTDSDIRYMAYAARLRTALRAGHRYVAYVCECLTHICVPAIDSHHRPVMLVKPSVQ